MTALARARYDGVELSLSGLTSSPAVLDECFDLNMRAICRLEAIADVSDAEAQLDKLSSLLSSRPDAASVVELVVLVAPHSSGLEDTLSYLHNIQPFWSEFLEAHQTIGSRHGKRNAHGNPLNHHVLGVCHRLSQGTTELAEIVDIYSPTRLALTADNLAASLRHSDDSPDSGRASTTGPTLPTTFDGLGDELDAVLEVSDLLYASPQGMAEMAGAPRSEQHHAPLWALWEEVWAAQQLAGADEAYLTCCDEDGAHARDDDFDDHVLLLARALRDRFDETAEWRAGAFERRAAAAAAAAAKRRLAPSSALGRAAEAFGLSPDDIDAVDRAGLKQRWRRLALQAHPDVVGGSGERFNDLRAAYKALLRATPR